MKKSISILTAILTYALLLVFAFFVIRQRIIAKDIHYKEELREEANRAMASKEKLYDVVFNDPNVKLVRGDNFRIPKGLWQHQITQWHRTNDDIKQVYYFTPRYERDVEWSGWCIHVLECWAKDHYFDYLLYPIAIGIHDGYSLSEHQLKIEIQNYFHFLSSKESDMTKQDDTSYILHEDLTSFYYSNKYYSLISANYSPYELTTRYEGPGSAALDGVGYNHHFLGQYHSNLIILPKGEDINKYDYYTTMDDGISVLYLYRKDLDAHTIVYRHYDKPMEKDFFIACTLAFSVLSVFLYFSLKFIKRS